MLIVDVSAPSNCVNCPVGLTCKYYDRNSSGYMSQNCLIKGEIDNTKGLSETDKEFCKLFLEGVISAKTIPEYGKIMKLIDDAPVCVHGTWIKREDEDDKVQKWHCSVCNHIIKDDIDFYPKARFCEHCGAIMSGTD